MSRATRYAAGLALVYVVLGAAYITASGSFALGVAGADVATLERIELAKGLGFVLVTGLLAFAVGRALLRRIAAHRSALAATRLALVQAEHQATAMVLAATLAHDLNNMLAVLRMGLDELEPFVASGEGQAVAEDMREAIERVSSLAGRLARAGKGVLSDPPETVDLARLVGEAVEAARLHPAVRRCEVELELESVEAEAKTSLLEQLVTNLILNAAEAQQHCHIRVTLRAEPGGGARLEVHDDGPGIPAEQQQRVFAPFHTTKASGTGLGLLSAKLAAAFHGGSVAYRDSPLGGACFDVVLKDAVETPEDAELGVWALTTDPSLGYADVAGGHRSET